MAIEITSASIKKGLRLSLLFSFLGLIALFYFTSVRESSIRETLSALKQIRPLYLLLALVLSMAEQLFGGWRIYLLGRVLPVRVRYGSSIRSSAANLFMAAITPTQTGGGPAQIFVLNRDGLPMPQAITLTVVTFTTTLTFMIFVALTLSIAGVERLAGLEFRSFVQYGTIGFLSVFVTFAVLLVRPRFLGSLARGGVRLISFVTRRPYHERDGVQRFIRAAEACHDNFVLYWQEGKLAFLKGIGITCCIFLSKFSIAWVVLRGVGLNATFRQVILIQVLITMITYFGPSPGSSGIAELVSAALMAKIVPSALLPIYTVLWRFFAMYFGGIIGGVILLKYLGRTQRDEPTDHQQIGLQTGMEGRLGDA